MSDVNDSRKVIKLVEEKLNMSVRDFIKRMDWEEDLDLVLNSLQGNLTNEQKGYLHSELSDLSHKMDNRGPIKYGRDLILNWLYEDFLLTLIKNHSTVTVQRSGEDADRKFLETTTTDPDFQLSIDGVDYLLEVTTDYSGHWQSVGEIDIRHSKYENMVDSDNTLLMGVDIVNKQLFVIEPSTLDAEETYNHAWNKMVYRGDSSNVEFTEFSNMIEELKDKAKNLS